MKPVKLNTNKPQCVVIAEEPLITLVYIDCNNNQELIDIYASDLRSSNVGDIFKFNHNDKQTIYTEELIVIFKTSDGCACVLSRFEKSSQKSFFEEHDDELFWFQLHNGENSISKAGA